MNSTESVPYTFDSLLAKVEQICAWKDSLDNRLQSICDLLHRELDTYNWVGFYFVDSQNPELVLGPYAGAKTDHVRIPFGRGICGQSAVSGETFLVDDVSAEDNYIACSMDVKSEIVVPLYQGDLMVGQIDIDSHTPAAFKKEDEVFLKAVNQKIAEILPVNYTFPS